MKGKLVLLLPALLLGGAMIQAAPLGTAISYQGRLDDSGSPANGTYSFRFRLLGDAAGTTPIGPVVDLPSQTLAAGLLNAPLDFGADAFNNDARWLEISVKSGGPGAASDYIKLNPRPLPPGGASQFARVAGDVLNGTITGAKLVPLAITTAHISDGAITAPKLGPASVTTGSIADNAITAAKIASGQVVKSLNGLRDAVTLAAGANVTLTSNGNTLTIASSGIWMALNGNAYYNAGNVGIGTTTPEDAALDVEGDVHINDRFLFLRPGSDRNHGLGYSGSVAGQPLDGPWLYGYGGGALGSPGPDTVALRWTRDGKVGIGTANPGRLLQLGDVGVQGSQGLIRLASRSASGAYSRAWDVGVPEGGDSDGDGRNYSFVIDDTSLGTTPELVVRYGSGNVGIGITSPQARLHVNGTILSGQGNTLSGNLAAIGGGERNQTLADYSTIGGGLGNQVQANSPGSFIGGGLTNTAGGEYASIAGGFRNAVSANWGTIPGGAFNTVDGRASFAAGINAHANHDFSFVWSDGRLPTYSEAARQFIVRASGGARFHTQFLEVSGTGNERAYLGGDGGGGDVQLGSLEPLTSEVTLWNAGSNARMGLHCRSVDSTYSVGGGSLHIQNEVGAVDFQLRRVVVAGLPSEYLNINPGNRGTVIQSSVNTGVALPSGGGAWDSLSDRSLKDNFEPISPRQILQGVVKLPVSRWNYRSQDASIRHIGPMAQDFHAAFNLGSDDKHISTIDADGVALAAIQGLNEVVAEKEMRIAELERRLEKLEQVLLGAARKSN